jgi:peptidoglycan/LPS O-acetylase OafA/YrhL
VAAQDLSGAAVRGNGFDGLRLAAAALVIVGHAYPLTGNAAPGLLANGIQTIAVKVFFVISGFLITGSWIADPNIARYILRRCLRIFPGLALLCLLTMWVIGPVFSSVGLVEYLRSAGTRFYFWNLALYPVYSLPGVFEHNTYGPAVNGSLWSLPVEVAMYICTIALASAPPRTRQIVIPLFAFVLLTASIYFVRLHLPAKPTVIWGTSMTSFLDGAYYFFAGSAIFVLRLQRYSNWWLGAAVFAVAAFYVDGSVNGEIVLALVLPYAVISIGMTHTRTLERLNGNDYSYGLYLYGFLIQQALIATIGRVTATANAIMALPIAFGLAMLSWHLIEKRALQLKPRRRKRLDPDKVPVEAEAA